ncbi:MFS transporter, partial [Leucobacter soli]
MELDPRAAAGSPLYRRALVALFGAGVATFALVYSPQALLPDIAREFAMSASASSFAIGATTLGLAAGMLAWAKVGERVGRVWAMRWAMVLAVAVGLITPFSPGFASLVVMRFIEGLMLAGLPAIAVTALAETVAPLALGSAVGAFIAGNTIGGLSGRIIAATTAEYFGWHGGLFCVALLALAGAVLFLILMPGPVVPAARSLPVFRALIENLRTPAVAVMVAQAFLLMGGFVAAYNYLAFRLQAEPFGLSPAQVSWLFLAYLAGAAASRGVWLLVRTAPPTGVLLGGLATMLLGLGVTLLPWLLAIIVGLVLFTVGFFGAHSVALTLASRRAGDGGRSVAPSLYNLAYYAGSTLFGWVGGLAFAAAGWGGAVAMV